MERFVQEILLPFLHSHAETIGLTKTLKNDLVSGLFVNTQEQGIFGLDES
jgi:hypothetical protein